MKCERVKLADVFGCLRENSGDPVLETYLPDSMVEMGRENMKRPCVLICPGGGYTAVSAREGDPIALKFTESGFNVFVLKYSVAPCRFPQQLREVAAAVELIYRNADSWKCDTRHIAAVGFSAGGHLAAHYSNAYDCPEVREVFPESKNVQAVILGYPVITSREEYTHKGSFRALLGEWPRDPGNRFSCENLVSENTPPTFIWHTAADRGVPVENSLLYAMELSRHKVPFELHVYPEGEHGLATGDEMTCDGSSLIANAARVKEWTEQAKNWLKASWRDMER